MMQRPEKATVRRGQVEDLTANAKPHTTLGPLIQLKYTTYSDICVSAVLTPKLIHQATMKNLTSNQILGENDTEHFMLFLHF